MFCRRQQRCREHGGVCANVASGTRFVDCTRRRSSGRMCRTSYIVNGLFCLRLRSGVTTLSQGVSTLVITRVRSCLQVFGTAVIQAHIHDNAPSRKDSVSLVICFESHRAPPRSSSFAVQPINFRLTPAVDRTRRNEDFVRRSLAEFDARDRQPRRRERRRCGGHCVVGGGANYWPGACRETNVPPVVA